jgi:hypothetical protein
MELNMIELHPGAAKEIEADPPTVSFGSISNKYLQMDNLEEQVVCRNFRHTTPHGAIEGKTQEKEVKYHNLKAIVAAGCRVNSHRAIAFRKWATGVLHAHIIKGFAMDDERLKQIKHFGQDYFKL